MKKLVGLSTVLVLVCIFISASPAFAPCDGLMFDKWIKEEGGDWFAVREGSMVWTPMGTDTHWMMRITVSLPSSWGGSIEDVIVVDRFGAEIEIDGYGPGDIMPASHGTASYITKGASNKVFLTWNIGTLNPGETATLEFEISTDLNPSGRQEYTTPSVCDCPETYYELNSGAVLKFRYEGRQYSAYTPQLLVFAWGQESD